MNILEDKFDIREYQNNKQTDFDVDGSLKLNQSTLSQFLQDYAINPYSKCVNVDKAFVDEYVQQPDNVQFTQVVTKEEFDDLNATVERMQKLTRDLESHIYYLENKMFEFEKKVKELEWPVNDEEK